MRRFTALLTMSFAAAACGGHRGAPAAAAAPAAAGPRATAPAGDPTSLHYSTTSGRYRVEQALHVSQEVMGQVTEIDATTTMLISAALTAADAGNLAGSFTVDSVTVTSSIPGAADAANTSRGKTWRSVFSAMGRPVAFTPPDSSAASVQTGDMFREFLPVLPAALAPGTTWVDTVRTTPNQPGMSMRSQSIRQHQVIGWETHDGVRALKISTNGTYSISGEGESQGQQLQMSGGGTSVSDRFVSAAGVFLGTTVRDSTNLTVQVVSAGIDVPVRQIRRSTITRLP